MWGAVCDRSSITSSFISFFYIYMNAWILNTLSNKKKKKRLYNLGHSKKTGFFSSRLSWFIKFRRCSDAFFSVIFMINLLRIENEFWMESFVLRLRCCEITVSLENNKRYWYEWNGHASSQTMDSVTLNKSTKVTGLFGFWICLNQLFFFIAGGSKKKRRIMVRDKDRRREEKWQKIFTSSYRSFSI